MIDTLKKTETAGSLAGEFLTINSTEIYDQSSMTGRLMIDLSSSIEKVYEDMGYNFNSSQINISYIEDDSASLILDEWIFSDNVQALLKDIK